MRVAVTAMSPAPTAILFPGQGAQVSDMRADVERSAPDLLEMVIEAVGADPFERLEEGTRYLQPAVFCRSVAGWLVARDGERPPAAFAGHSLGEIGALVAAEALGLEDACRLIALRGELTARVLDDHGMLAVALDEPDAKAIADRFGVTVACYNAPAQVVLSGDAEALRSAAETVHEAGGKAVMLNIAGAFHSPVLEQVVPEFRAALEQVRFREPVAPVLSCVAGEPFSDPARELAESLTQPVLWTRVTANLAKRGINRFVQMPPGRRLCKLVRAIVPGAETTAVQGTA